VRIVRLGIRCGQAYEAGSGGRERCVNETDLILVVEDDSLVSDVIEAALDGKYRTVVVENANDAMSTLREQAVRLMLLDCTLPGGVSPDLLPEADRRGTSVILMSGDPDRVKRVSETPRPFVRKPFTLAGLLEAVNAVLTAA
jgi:DNA-binding NtrC family response regulator